MVELKLSSTLLYHVTCTWQCQLSLFGRESRKDRSAPPQKCTKEGGIAWLRTSPKLIIRASSTLTAGSGALGIRERLSLRFFVSPDPHLYPPQESHRDHKCALPCILVTWVERRMTATSRFQNGLGAQGLDRLRCREGVWK